MGIAAKHLPEFQRASIARTLFKVTSMEEAKGELHGLCPIHGESNPSFSYNYKKDVYHCLSCNADGDLLRLWCEVQGYNQKEGFKAFCEEYGIETATGRRTHADSGTEKEQAAIDSLRLQESMETAWEKFVFLPEVWLKRLEEERGWSRRIIEILDLRLQTCFLNKKGGLSSIALPERVAIPVRDLAGRLMNIRLYAPGAKQYKIISWASSTGKARLFPAKPLYDDQPILLCEGESDTICALTQGFNAITQTSKLKNWPKEHLVQFKNRDVIIAYDADEPGQKYARYAADALSRTAKSIRMVSWPSFMIETPDGKIPAKGGQDLTDFFIRHKKMNKDLQELIDAAPVYAVSAQEPPGKASNDLEKLDGPAQFFERGINDRLSFKPRLLAEKIMKEHSLLSDPETGLMYRWNGKYWERYDEDQIRKFALQELGSESQKSRAEDAVYQVKMLATIPHGRKINDHDNLICLQNGMFSLTDFQITPHDPKYLCTYSLPVSFNPESERTCERWLRYLAETVQTPESIAQLQEFMGYLLVRHTKYEKCLLLIGPGSDGKSTFLKIMQELIGSENCAAISFQDLEDQFQRSSLYNKMLNISTEVGAKAIESPYFKAITSGDPISAAFKHKNNFTFSPFCKLAFAANRLPRVLDNSDGFFRRVLPVQFKRQFPDDDPTRDADLFETLKDELSEIFAWAVVGLLRLIKQKRFTNSNETKALMNDYRRINNPVVCFVEDVCAFDEYYETLKSDLYNSYKNYCGKNGYSPMSNENFFRELYVAAHNIRQHQVRVDGRRQRYIRGIMVKINE